MLRVFLLTVLGIAAGIFILPKSSKADYATLGYGAVTCGKISSDYRNTDPDIIEATTMAWATGFMSGMNMEALLTKKLYRDLEAMTIAAQKQSIFSYCDNHPLAQFMSAVLDLYKQFPLKKFSPPPSR